jgi:hypothetical protein
LDEQVAARCRGVVEVGVRRSSSRGPVVEVDAGDNSRTQSTRKLGGVGERSVSRVGTMTGWKGVEDR